MIVAFWLSLGSLFLLGCWWIRHKEADAVIQEMINERSKQG